MNMAPDHDPEWKVRRVSSSALKSLGCKLQTVFGVSTSGSLAMWSVVIAPVGGSSSVFASVSALLSGSKTDTSASGSTGSERLALILVGKHQKRLAFQVKLVPGAWVFTMVPFVAVTTMGFGLNLGASFAVCCFCCTSTMSPLVILVVHAFLHNLSCEPWVLCPDDKLHHLWGHLERCQVVIYRSQDDAQIGGSEERAWLKLAACAWMPAGSFVGLHPSCYPPHRQHV